MRRALRPARCQAGPGGTCVLAPPPHLGIGAVLPALVLRVLLLLLPRLPPPPQRRLLLLLLLLLAAARRWRSAWRRLRAGERLSLGAPARVAEQVQESSLSAEHAKQSGSEELCKRCWGDGSGMQAIAKHGRLSIGKQGRHGVPGRGASGPRSMLGPWTHPPGALAAFAAAAARPRGRIAVRGLRWRLAGRRRRSPRQQLLRL